MSRDLRKILLIRLSALGDVVLATAAVEALAEELPGAAVHVLTKPEYGEVFADNPAVARVLSWPRELGPAALAAAVRAERYDAVVDLHGNLRTWLLRALVRQPRWVRYRKAALRRRAAVLCRRPQLLQEVHVVDRYLGALAPLGVGGRRRRPRLYPGSAERDAVARALPGCDADDRELVALAPGARWPTKAWPELHWRDLVAAIAAEGRRAVLVGGAEDADLCQRIAAAADGAAASAAGRLSPLASAALLGRCRALVSNDSAALHLAEAVGTPVVALFGPTVRGFGFFPLGDRAAVLERVLPCRPCSLHGGLRCPEGHHVCLAEIGAGEVAEVLQAVLSHAPPGAP